MCALLFVFFNFSFTVYCVICCAHFFLFVARACLYIVLYSDVGRKLSINGYNFIFLAYTNVCSVTELTQWVAPPEMVCTATGFK